MEFTNQSETFTFSGTARDFVASHITLNGKALDPVTVNSLAKHNLLEATGWGAKPARGRTPRIFKAVSRDGFNFGKMIPITKPVVQVFESNPVSVSDVVDSEIVNTSNIETTAAEVIATTEESFADEVQSSAIEASVSLEEDNDLPF